MSQISSYRPWAAFVVAAAACLHSSHLIAQGGNARPPTAMETASQIAQFSGAPGGICATMGSTDGELATALAKEGSFVVHCLTTDAEHCNRMREAIRARGMYGTVSASTFGGERLPYVDNLVNIVVVDSYPALRKARFSAEEVVRVLAPLGCAYVGTSSKPAGSATWTEELTAQLRKSGIEELSVVERGGTWVRFKKPWPADIDEWTHYLHGPDGNPVAQDRVVGPRR